MLDFPEKTYQKVFNLAWKSNILANCREYPALIFNRQRIGFEGIKEALAKKFSDRRLACGLYTHFPFCESRCIFCKYYSEIVPTGSKREIFDAYLKASETELNLYGVNFSGVELDNICLGGGTPTLLDEAQIYKYLEIIHRFFRVKRDAQISIEGTPETITLPKIRAYKKAGINRISLGLQSLNDAVLRRIGRRHTVSDVRRAFFTARQGGIKTIAADIMWGLPGEDRLTYENTIKTLIRLAPEFVEGFILTSGGRVRISRFYPSDANIDAVIKTHKEEFIAHGYRIHCAGNFLGVIKKGVPAEAAVNQNMDGLYNCCSFVLGIGAGASSHFNDFKYKIVSDSGNYLGNLSRGVAPLFYGAKFDLDDYKRQFIISRIGFFRSIRKNRYRELFGVGLEDDFPMELDALKKNGTISEDKNWYFWNLDEREMGHHSFFDHVIRYWYHPKYIRKLIN